MSIVTNVAFVFRNRNDVEMGVPYATLNRQLISMMPHGLGWASQDGDFQAVLMPDMYMGRGDAEVVMRMLRVDQPPR
jgi:hypothetical protein